MDPRRLERLSELAGVAFAVFAARGLCLLLFLAASSPANVESYGEFLSFREGQTRQERLREIQAGLVERLAPFDGQFYLDIASRGYRSFEEWPGGNFAFFPLYPIILSLLGCLGGPTPLVAAVTQLALSATAGVFVYLMAERLAIPPWMPLALMLTWPAGVFHVLVYTESLFLFLSTLVAYLCLDRPRLGAAAAGFLAGLARPQGILVSLLLLPIGPANRPGRRERHRILLFLTPILGFATYVIIIKLRFGSALAFIEMQRSWGRSPSFLGVFRAVLAALTFQGLVPDAISALGGLVMIPLLFLKLPLPLALFGTGSILMPLSSGTHLSMCRFMSVAFPFFLGLAGILRKRPIAVSALVLSGAAVQVWFVRRLAGWEFAG